MAFFPTFSKRGSYKGGGSLTVYDDFWYSVLGTEADSGERVTATSAMQHPAVLACVTLIAQTKAQLPLKVIRVTNNGRTKEDATDHPLYYLLKTAPNNEITSYNWREAYTAHILLSGNKYSWIERSRNGIKGLWLLDPDKMTPKRVNGRIVYEYHQDSGNVRRYKAEDILHIAGFGSDGLMGQSVITNFAKNTVGVALGLERFKSNFFKNGIYSSGTFETPNALGKKRPEFIKAVKKRFSGSHNSSVPMILEQGMKWEPHEVKLADAQFLELTRASKIDICGIFKVPPHKIAVNKDSTSYNNTEQENRSFVDTCLMPLLVCDEQAMESRLLTAQDYGAGYRIKYNVRGLLRGDSQSRAEYYNKLFQAGAITPNEIRRLEDMNPVANGDEVFVQSAMVPISMAGQTTGQPAAARSQCDCHDHDEAAYMVEYRNNESKSQRLANISTRHKPHLEKVAEGVVAYEVDKINEAVDRFVGTRSAKDLQEWLQVFYDQHLEYVRDKFSAALETYAREIHRVSTDIVGKDIGITPEYERFLWNYLERFAFRHCHAGRNQLTSLIDTAKFDVLSGEVKARTEEWLEKRAGKIAADEAVRMRNAMSLRAWQDAEVEKLVWHTRGSETCPFCKVLNGRVVGINKEFLRAGDVIYVGPDGFSEIYNPEDGTKQWDNPDFDPKGEGTKEGFHAMKVRGAKKHAPIHAGCDCQVLPA